jgi:sulfatase modifying factor 1
VRRAAVAAATSAGSGGATGGSGGSNIGGSGGATGGSGGSNIGGSGGATGGSGGSNVGGSGGATGGSGGSNVGGSGGSSCPNPCGSLEECWNGQYCVAKKVQVTGGYAIDATEVTRDQYAAWLATNPSTSGQPSYCSWNDDFTPGCEWPPGVKGNHPVVCVDWCDAYAYCAAVGKRLCGKIGGGANAYKDYDDATKSQWYNVCSSGGQKDYPYGYGYSESACNGYSAGNNGTVPVGSMSGCESSVSGYTGVYDLSGNAWEWEDSCNGYVDDMNLCLLRGGSFNNAGLDNSLRCDGGLDSYRRNQFGSFGFRCCTP